MRKVACLAGSTLSVPFCDWFRVFQAASGGWCRLDFGQPGGGGELGTSGKVFIYFIVLFYGGGGLQFFKLLTRFLFYFFWGGWVTDVL